jgi:hypothetical protein
MAQVIELLVHGGFAYFDQEEERIIAINTLTAKRTANAFCFGLSPFRSGGRGRLRRNRGVATRCTALHHYTSPPGHCAIRCHTRPVAL